MQWSMNGTLEPFFAHVKKKLGSFAYCLGVTTCTNLGKLILTVTVICECIGCVLVKLPNLHVQSALLNGFSPYIVVSEHSPYIVVSEQL